MAWYAVNFVRMVTDEVCLTNLTVLFFSQRASVTWFTRPSRAVLRFCLFWWGMCIFSFQTVPKQTFTPCYYFLSRGGSHREGGLANPSCTWLMGLLQGCTYLFYMSWIIFSTSFAIKRCLLPEIYGFLNVDMFCILWVCVGWCVASRFEMCTVFRHSNTGIVESNPAWGMDVNLMSEFILCCPVLVGNCTGSKRCEKVSSDKIHWDFLMWKLAENYSLSTADETRTWPATRVWLTLIVNIITGRSADGARGGIVVKALRYKPAGRGFDSRWYHWNFSVT